MVTDCLRCGHGEEVHDDGSGSCLRGWGAVYKQEARGCDCDAYLAEHYSCCSHCSASCEEYSKAMREWHAAPCVLC